MGQAGVSEDLGADSAVIANAQTEELARELFADLVCESAACTARGATRLARPSQSRHSRLRSRHEPGRNDRGGVRPCRGVTDARQTAARNQLGQVPEAPVDPPPEQLPPDTG